jgi:hypothetical protein
MQGLKEADEGSGYDQDEVDAEMRQIIADARAKRPKDAMAV